MTTPQSIQIKPRIKPKCQAKPGNGMHGFQTVLGNMYVTQAGYVVPCCWMGTQRELTALWDKSGLDRDLHNMEYHSIQEIIDGPIWEWIDNNMNNFRLCIEKCIDGKYDTWTHEYDVSL